MVAAWQVSYQNICYAKSFRIIRLVFFFSSLTRTVVRLVSRIYLLSSFVPVCLVCIFIDLYNFVN